LDDNYSISINNNITTCQLITHNQPDNSPKKQEKEACICRWYLSTAEKWLEKW